MKLETFIKRKSKIDRLKLLNLVKELGSISAAAKSLGVSYKAAWEAVEQINNMSTVPLLERTTGGEKGGGTVFTPHGDKFLMFMKEFDEQFQYFLTNFGKATDEMMIKYMQVIRFSTSANNQFGGRITSLVPGAVNTEVVMDIGEGDQITAIITNSSAKSMGLMVGSEVCALINASSIVLTRDENILTSARNKLTGLVSWCDKGQVNSEVVLKLAGGKSLTAIITDESLNGLALKIGDRACALIKASQVLLASI